MTKILLISILSSTLAMSKFFTYENLNISSGLGKSIETIYA
jgi:hypothetical protein